MGIKPPETDYMKMGKEAHLAIQKHCLGKKDPRLVDFDWVFQQSEYHAKKVYNDKILLHGYFDLISFKSKVFAEIKTSSHPWSQQRFHESMQPKYYASIIGFRKALFITCKFDLTDFKTFYAELSDKDIEKAENWTKEAVDGIDAGIFTTDLVDGRCELFNCPYGEACYFKHEKYNSTK